MLSSRLFVHEFVLLVNDMFITFLLPLVSSCGLVVNFSLERGNENDVEFQNNSRDEIFSMMVKERPKENTRANHGLRRWRENSFDSWLEWV